VNSGGTPFSAAMVTGCFSRSPLKCQHVLSNGMFSFATGALSQDEKTHQ
jgi:hypothetical protein